jgi:serine/threonine protein phosphatase PrpC
MLLKNKPKYIFDSITGINKKENQDNLFVLNTDEYSLYALFDGVGSAINSKKATQLAIEFIKKNNREFLSTTVDLNRLLFEANNFIIGQQIPEALTTYCIVYIPNQPNLPVYYSSMGDTRLYAKTKQYIEQLTVDDRVEGTKNIITKCLGLGYMPLSDFSQWNYIRVDEELLICTDGFYSFLEENRLTFFELLNKKSLKSIKDSLAQFIINKNQDDSTYIFIK